MKNNEKVYVVEYRGFNDRSFKVILEGTGTFDEVKKDIIKHHRKARREFKKSGEVHWLTSENKTEEVLDFDKDYYTFIQSKTNIKTIPSKMFRVIYGVSITDDGWTIEGREIYNLFEMNCSVEDFWKNYKKAQELAEQESNKEV